MNSSDTEGDEEYKIDTSTKYDLKCWRFLNPGAAEIQRWKEAGGGSQLQNERDELKEQLRCLREESEEKNQAIRERGRRRVSQKKTHVGNIDPRTKGAVSKDREMSTNNEIGHHYEVGIGHYYDVGE
jgi:2',3'-cyclic-nucleotide 2'-phosphodiesterase (5'-nucleotidase family)